MLAKHHEQRKYREVFHAKARRTQRRKGNFEYINTDITVIKNDITDLKFDMYFNFSLNFLALAA